MTVHIATDNHIDAQPSVFAQIERYAKEVGKPVVSSVNPNWLGETTVPNELFTINRIDNIALGHTLNQSFTKRSYQQGEAS
jgi:hypothetical protein